MARSLDHATCPVVWGGTGTPGQHAFHQWLHQGTEACRLRLHRRGAPHGQRTASHHEILLAHACAQSEALMEGVAAEPHKRLPRRPRRARPSCCRALDAMHLGALLAIYEHKVFVQGVVWGINSFDQCGVELGKTIAGQILPAVRGGEAPLHPATRHLLGVIQKLAQASSP